MAIHALAMMCTCTSMIYGVEDALTELTRVFLMVMYGLISFCCFHNHGPNYQ